MLTDDDWTAIIAAAEKRRIPRETARSWRKPDRRIPAEHVPVLSELTGIAAAKMRPDVFGKRRKAA